MTSSKEEALGNSQQEINASDGSVIQDTYQTKFDRPVDNVHIGPTYARSKQEELSDYLAHAVAVYKGYLYQAVVQSSHPSSPYKLLSSFSIKDSLIFCGRTNAIEEFCKKVFQSRLLVLHAKSGAGKTSLLNAGLSPYIIRHGHFPLYIHTYDRDPIWMIKQSLMPTTLGSWPDGLRDLSLHEFLAHVCNYLKRENIEELVIILDQFEDFFLYWTQPSERLPFIKALGDCYRDQTLPIRIIIALRKDYYSDLTEFEDVLPDLHIFQNHYRPSAMTQQEAKEAIVKPLKELNSTVTYEPVLLDTLLADLSRDEIELPLLQMICTRLYETRGIDKKRITMKTYEALGKTEGVLTTYLNEVLAGLPEKEKVLAKNILKEFLRSDMTKQTISYTTLTAQIETQENDLDRILTQLVNARLLCKDDIEGETRYELVHEYLVTEIAKWMDVADREFRRAEELLRSELANWHSYGHRIDWERLEVLYPYRERFRGLDAEDWECLIRSVIDAEENFGNEDEEFDVTNWVKVVSDIDTTLLSKAIVEPLLAELRDDASWKRSQAAKNLAMVGEYAGMQVVEPLLFILQDENASVRAHAAMALGEIGDTRAVEPLLSILQDKDESVRVDAARALGKLEDIRAAEPLLSALQIGNWGAAVALGRLRDVRAFEPLIVMLKNEDENLRRWAAMGLGELGDVRAVEPLIASLQNEDSHNIRIGQVVALGKLGDVRAVEPLIVALRGGWSFFVRQDAAEALGKLGGARAVEPLIAASQDQEHNVCKWAEWALANIENMK